tara:strand:- start:307 stop:1395 length:1089 start_codon:yes stop_codon:yes gene_type:complete
MKDLTGVLDIAPYSLDRVEKRAFLNDELRQCTRLHYEQCVEYRRMMDATGLNLDELPEYDELPFLPVRLFKEFELKSVSEDKIVKTMTSSMTTGQHVSKIFLDRPTSTFQTKALTKIVSEYLGTKRVPMLILDSSSVLKNRNMFSARGAGILGFSMFGSKREYAFNEKMELDVSSVKNFLETHRGERIFMFGFTFMIWQHFYKELKAKNYSPDLSNAILIHGGGWKKLVSESVSKEQFKKCLNDMCGIKTSNIHDYYGMVEQTGTIYMECDKGHLHTSVFSDVLIRNHENFSLAGIGERGLIEVVSILPQSYPGHVLLTEDEGEILGEDDCTCARKGKYFKIFGRVKNAEIRGCSDTYETKF